MIRERAAAALLAVAAIGLAAPAQADPVRVAIVHGSEAIPLARRVEAELGALGIAVVDITTANDALANDAELDAAARLAGATAAIRIAAPSASVWIAGSDGKQYVIRVVTPDGAAASPDAVLALRAVELVRTALLDPLSPAPAPPPTARPPVLAAPTPEVVDRPITAPAPPSRWMLEVAPAVVGAPGAVPLTASLLLGARWMPGSLGPAVVAVVPLFPARLDGPEGTADVRAAMLGAGLDFAPRSRDASLQPSVQAGLAGVWMLIDGVARSGYVGKSDNLLFAAPYLRAGLALSISPHVALRADLLGAVALARPSIIFAGREAASWGRPVLLGSGGVEVSIP